LGDRTQAHALTTGWFYLTVKQNKNKNVAAEGFSKAENQKYTGK